jgi:hypothetical protein
MVFMPMPLGPAEFLVDLRGIEGVRLPHLELVDGVGGNVVAAHQPALRRVPGIGLLTVHCDVCASAGPANSKANASGDAP